MIKTNKKLIEETKKGATYYFGKGEMKVVFNDGVIMEMKKNGNVIVIKPII